MGHGTYIYVSTLPILVVGLFLSKVTFVIVIVVCTMVEINYGRSGLNELQKLKLKMTSQIVFNIFISMM